MNPGTRCHTNGHFCARQPKSGQLTSCIKNTKTADLVSANEMRKVSHLWIKKKSSLTVAATDGAYT